MPSFPRHLTPMLRTRRFTAGLAATSALLAASVGAAQATWHSAGAGQAQSVAASVPPGSVPGTVVSAKDVSLSWTAGTMSDATIGYTLSRYDATSGTPQTIGAGCGGVRTSTGCTEANVPAGSWAYTVTPVVSTWTGAESAKSATVTISDLANAGFESGLTEWTTSPASLVQTVTTFTSSDSNRATYGPHAGANFAVLTAGAQGVYTALSRSFHANAGQTISGWAFFKAGDYAPYNDDGAVMIEQGGVAVAPPVFAAGVATVGDYGRTPWTEWRYTFPTSGTFTISAKVQNVRDSGQVSWLGLDDIRITP